MNAARSVGAIRMALLTLTSSLAAALRTLSKWVLFAVINNAKPNIDRESPLTGHRSGAISQGACSAFGGSNVRRNHIGCEERRFGARGLRGRVRLARCLQGPEERRLHRRGRSKSNRFARG